MFVRRTRPSVALPILLACTMLVSNRAALSQSDSCELAEAVLPGSYSGETSSARSLGSAECGRSSTAPDRFYSFTAAERGRLEVTTCGSSYDTVLSVHGACPATSANALVCNDDDEDCGLHSTAVVDLGAGERVWIRVSGFAGANGSYDLDVTFREEGAFRGPDPAVTDMSEFRQVGRVGSEVAFTTRTVICNMGEEVMDWYRNPDPRHPFLVFNMYRLMNDRIEQIGASWVKHGYSASQGGGCGATCNAESGNQNLGPGCSDVYGTSANSRQSTFGPRTDIDPWTGRFEFDGSHLDVTDLDDHTPIEHLLRVEDDDLDPAQNPGASYFVELYVIAHDDVEHENSIGYKPVDVAGRPGREWNVAMAPDAASPGTVLWDWFGGTFTILPEGPPVGDGRAYLKTKVTDNGDGTWHYEYALFNLDIARAIGTFRVPVWPNVEVTNIGFHAVRSVDEGFDNEPWDVSRTDEHIVWATTPHDAGSTSNPLRWGTMYNFRFDASVPPVDSIVGFDMFRPGDPVGHSGAAQAPSLPVPPTPQFKRADTDGNGLVELSDALVVAGFLFLGEGTPGCLDAADADDSGEHDISDIIAPLNWLFSGGGTPPAPGPFECGRDTTPADPPFAPCEYDGESC